MQEWWLKRKTVIGKLKTGSEKGTGNGEWGEAEI
jgi:hypothetical protein